VPVEKAREVAIWGLDIVEILADKTGDAQFLRQKA
jgi:hypothetical protein